MAAPYKFAHIGLRTHDLATARSWYLKVLDGKPVFENDRVCFMAYDEEHHRVVLFHDPDFKKPAKPRSGGPLHHFTYTFATLDDLLDKHTVLREAGIEPIYCLNHGPTLSMYYADPMNNSVELQIDTMTMDQAFEFMYSDVFKKNFTGIPFDPVELAARRRAGASFDAIVKYE